MRLNGKIAICTAAGQGIGRAVAEAFLREGAQVYATDLDPAKLAGLGGAGVAITGGLDVTDGDAVTAYLKDVPTPDILFNCAGIVHHGSIAECTDDDWERAFNINVRGTHLMMQNLAPRMAAATGGSIINVASAASSIKAAPDRYVYMATKAAMIGMTRSVAIDYIRSGIRCNAVCPGTIESPSLEERIITLGKTMGGTERARAAFTDRQPMGRLGRPSEIAALAIWLASDESAFVTGTTQVIDGGWTL